MTRIHNRVILPGRRNTRSRPARLPCLSSRGRERARSGRWLMFERRMAGMTRPGGLPLSRRVGEVMTKTAPPTAKMRPDDLQDWPDAELLTMIHSLPRGTYMRDLACEVLVTRYQPLVRSCVLRYRNSVEPQ